MRVSTSGKSLFSFEREDFDSRQRRRDIALNSAWDRLHFSKIDSDEAAYFCKVPFLMVFFDEDGVLLFVFGYVGSFALVVQFFVFFLLLSWLHCFQQYHAVLEADEVEPLAPVLPLVPGQAPRFFFFFSFLGGDKSDVCSITEVRSTAEVRGNTY